MGEHNCPCRVLGHISGITSLPVIPTFVSMKNVSKTSKIAQWVEALTAKSDNQDPHGRRKRINSCKLSFDLHITYTYTNE